MYAHSDSWRDAVASADAVTSPYLVVASFVAVVTPWLLQAAAALLGAADAWTAHSSGTFLLVVAFAATAGLGMHWRLNDPRVYRADADASANPGD
ncbi:hypothetical protein [Halobaculum sp. D14]|uniref:hypothetical protein n=1 Tax=Halobaculum sp. D14 TaxID=3421642 RepID=UPI003EBC8872